MMLRNTVLYGLGRVVPGIIALAGISVYTRMVDPAAFGRYTVVLTASGLLASLLLGWMRAGLLRFTSGTGGRRPVVLATALRLFLLLAGALLVAAAVWDGTAGIALEGFPILLVALCTVASGGADLALTAMQTGMQVGRHLWISLARAVVRFGVSVALLVVAGWEGLALLWGVIAASSLTSVLALGSLGGCRGIGRWSDVSARRLWRFGWPTCVKSVMTFAEASLDRFLLVALVDASAAGIYAAATGLISMTLYRLCGVAAMSGLPLVVRTIEREGLQASREPLSRFLTFLLGLALPAALGMWLLNDGICNVLIGEAFREGVIPILPLVVLAAILGELRGYYSDFAFEAVRQPKKQLPVTFAAAAASLVLNLALIPRYGVLGAAIAAVLSRTLALALSIVLIRRIFPLPLPLANVAKILAACGVLWLVLLPTLDHRGWAILIGQIAAGASAYGLAAFALDIGGVRQSLRPVIGRRLRSLTRRAPAD
jgi:O-antigen/teichoic acid export membrane protein